MARPDIARINRVVDSYPKYAGLWSEGDVVHVAFVDPAEGTATTLRAAAPSASQIIVETVRWTLVELAQAKRIAQHLMTDDSLGIMLVGIDIRGNKSLVGIQRETLESTRALIERELDRASLAGSAEFRVSEGVTYDY